MPIGSGIVYNTGDLILSQVSSSGTAFLETKIASATSSLIYFDSTARINSASLNSITVGTASYVSGSRSIITNLTASNISASSITGSLFGTSSWAVNAVTASFVSNAFVQGGNSFGTTALLGTNDANSLAFETNGSTRMTINSGGQVGIGGFPVSHYKTYIADTHRGSLGSSSLWIDTAQNQNQGLATSANDSGITNVYTVNNFTSSTVLQNQASFNQMIIAGSGSFSGSYRAERNGILFSNSASLDSSGNIVNTYLTNQISSNIPTFSIPNWVAGTQTYVDLITGNSTGSITNLYNHQINSPFPSGGSGGITVNNSYGIYIAKQKTTNIVTNGWGIYQIDTGDLNIFAGKTRIGSTTVPVNTLDVTGNISASVVTASLFFGTASFALTASSLVAANSYTITNLTASNISASGTSSFGYVGIGTTIPLTKLQVKNGSITAGTADSTNGTTILLGQYSSGNLTVLGSEYSSGGPFLGYGVSPSTASAASFFSSTPINIVRSAYIQDGGTHRWYLGPTQSGSIGTVANLSEVMRIASDGSVGIGTTTVNQKLSIYPGTTGGISLQDSGGDTRSYFFIDNTNPTYSTGIRTNNYYLDFDSSGGAQNAIRFYTGTSTIGTGTERMRIVSGGNVGIGTTAPGALLEISSSTAASLLNIKGAGGNGILFVSGSGNVGIGTTSPVSKLHVYSGNGTAQIFNQLQLTNMGTPNTGDIVGIGFAAGESTQYGVKGSIGFIRTDTFGRGAITFYTNNTAGTETVSTSNERMRIDASGGINIGTPSQLNSSRVSIADSAVKTSAGNCLTFATATGGSNDFQLIISRGSNTNGYYALQSVEQGVSYKNIVFNQDGGNVGIGTTSPVAKLQVNGNVSGSSFTSSISNAVGFLGTASWAQNVVSASFATTAQTANALNASNTYTIAGLTSAYVDVNGSSAPTTGIYRPSTKTLGLSADSTLIFKISNVSAPATSSIETGNFLVSGSVGIGTTSPADKLSVISGSVRIASSSLAGALYLGNDGNNIYLERDNNYDLSLVQNGDSNRALYLASAGNVYVNIDSNNNDTDKAFIVQNNALKAGTELFRVSETGNVGIGQSNPNNKLDIFGGTGTTLNMSNVDDGNRGGKLTFISSSATGRQFYVGTNSSIYNLVFGIDSIEKARIDTNGNLGIGITSPTVRLHVSGSSIITNPNPSANSAVLLVQDEGTATTVKDGTTLRVVNNGSAANFSVFEASSGVSDFVILNNGNVGIGTTAPGALLEISSSTASSLLNVKGAGGNGILFVSGSGNVGIGTTVPVAKLQVAGAGIFASELLHNSSDQIGWVNAKFTDYNDGHGIYISSLQAGGGKWLSGEGRYWNSGLWRSTSTTSTAISLDSGALKFYTNSGLTANSDFSPSERMRINSDGNVGIGTTLPIAKLQVAGNISGSSFTSSVSNAVGFLGTSSWANNVVSASYATTAQTANALNTGNSYTIAGLTNNGTLSQQGTLSMGSGYQILATTGTVTNPGISFVGDTNTGFYTPSADNIGIVTNGSEKVRIDSSGNVGVGSSSPSSKFEVLTSAVGLANQPNIIGNFRGDTDGRSLIRVDNTSTSAGAAALQAGISFVAYSNVSSQPSANKHEAQIILGSTGATSVPGGQTGTLQIVAPQDIAFNVSASNTIMTGSNYTAFGYNAMYIARSGNVGIGTTSPSFKLDVSGSGANARIGNAEIGQWPAATAYTYFGHEALDHSVGGNYAVVQSSAGETFINSAAGQVMHFSVGNSEKVQINSSGNVGINTQGSVINAKLTISGSGSDALLHIKSPISGAILYVSGSGAVGIGTSNVGAFTLQVSGSFGATTKSFIIDHPTKAGKKLMYGSLESPYHGIRLTGRDTLVNGKCKIQLPDYIYKLILHDSVNIQLTGIKCNKTLYVDEINIPENYFTIAYDKAIFESYKDYDFFWDFTAIRADVPELNTEL
jgi:hypothetical protein